MMRLIGNFRSPYARRLAISLKLLRLPFEHQSLSVFGDFEEIGATNPVVKVPTLVTPEGVVLMDSILILQHLEPLASRKLCLTPAEAVDRARSQRMIGLALAAAEKTVQLVYERRLRPQGKQHQAWDDRLIRQLSAAFGEIEGELDPDRDWQFGPRPMQADVTASVVWNFTHAVFPGLVSRTEHPVLEALHRRAESLPEFRACPLP